MALSDFADLGAVAAPSQASGFSDLGAVPASSDAKPQTAKDLAADPNFDPVQYAKGFDEPPQIARDVFQLRQNGGGPQTSLFQDVGRSAKGLGMGIVNFAKLPYYGAQTAVNAGQALLADDDKAKLTAMIAAQNSENRLGETWDALTGPNSWLRNSAETVGHWADPTEIGPQTPATKSADVDAQFNQLVAHAKTQDQLDAGKVQDAGPTAAIARAAYGLGQINAAADSQAQDIRSNPPNPLSAYAPPPASQITPTPQDLTQEGTPWTPADAQRAGNISQAADPTLILPAMGAGSELAQKMAGRVVQAGGKVLSAAEPLFSYGSKKLTPAYISGATMYGGPMMGLKAAALGGASWLGGRVIGAIGRLGEDVGGEAATGVPGDLSARLGQAAVTGTSDLSAAMQKRIGQAAVGAVAAPIAMAPLNALITKGDPEQFGAAEGSAVGIGAMSGGTGFRFRPEILSQADAYLQRQGAQPTGDNAMDALHNKAMYGGGPMDQDGGLQGKSPQDANAINAVRGVFQGMPVDTGTGKKASANIYALTPQDFAAELQKRGVSGTPQELAQQQGYYDPKTGQALINTGTGDAAGTGAYESGRIGEKVLELMGQNGSPLHSAMTDTLGQGLITNGQPNRLFQRFIDQYKAGATPEVQAIPNDDPYWKRSFLADTVRRVIGKNGVADSAVPKALSDKILSNLGQFWGRMTGTSGSFSTSNPAQVRAINEAATDMLRTIAGAKFRTGFGDLQPGAAPPAQAAPPSAPITPPSSVAAAMQRTIRPPAGLGQAPAPPISAPLNILDAVSGKVAPSPEMEAAVKPAPPTVPRGTNVPQQPVNGSDVAKAMKTLGVKPGAKYSGLQQKIAEAFAAQGNGAENASKSPKVAATPVNESPESGQSGPQSVTKTAPVSSQIAEPEEPVPFGELHTWKQPEGSGTPAQRTAEIVAKIPADAPGLKSNTDRFGKTRVSGDIDPENPIHQQILAVSGLDQRPDALAHLQEMQSSKGDVKYIDYLSAKSGEGEHSGVKRAKDYAASSVQQRLADAQKYGVLQKGKAFIPLGTLVTNDGNVLSTGYSPDKLNSNIALIAKAAVKAGIPVKFDPSDVQRAIENHAHGYKGDGSGPFISDVTPAPDPNYDPVKSGNVIPADRYQIVNMAMQETGATKTASKQAATRGKAQEAQALAAANRAPIGERGEVNPLRESLKRSGFDADKQLESPFESLYPELMTSVSDTPGTQDIVRPGSKGDIRQVFAQGIPNSTMARAGFRPKSVAEKGSSGQNESDEISQRNPLESAAQYVGGSARATPQHDDDWTTRQGRSANEARRLEEWAKSNGKFGGPSITEQKRGSEHIVHFDESSGRWGKQTRPESGDGFGIALTNTGQGSTPGEYLDRLTLANKIFDDDIRLERVVKNGGKLSIVTSQPDISGREATNPEIDASMAQRGFRKLAPGIFYGAGESDGVLVHDMVPRNAIFSNGRAVPIDPAIQRATPELASFIRSRGGFSSASNRSLQSEMFKQRIDPALRLKAAMAQRQQLSVP